MQRIFFHPLVVGTPKIFWTVPLLSRKKGKHLDYQDRQNSSWGTSLMSCSLSLKWILNITFKTVKFLLSQFFWWFTTFSQINVVIDITHPSPRIVNAGIKMLMYKMMNFYSECTQIKIRHSQDLQFFFPDKFTKPFGVHKKAGLLKCKI